MISEWSRTISNQICENQNEKEIIQYGLNQFFWILLNLDYSRRSRESG